MSTGGDDEDAVLLATNEDAEDNLTVSTEQKINLITFMISEHSQLHEGSTGCHSSFVRYNVGYLDY